MKKLQVSDEFLARFIEGKTSEEENSQLAQLLDAENDSLDELSALGEAAKLADTPPQKKPDISLAEQQIKSALNLHTTATGTDIKHRNKAPLYWAAAAIILALVISSFFALFLNRHNDKYLAGQQGDNVHPIDTVTTIIDTTSKDVAPQSTPIQTPSSSSMINEPKHYADSARKRNYTSMIYPSSQLTSITENTQSLNFRWNSDAVHIHLLIKNEHNKTIVDQDLGTAKYYKLNIPQNEDTLQWQAIFTYSDGNTLVKKGKIIRWDVGIKTK